MAARLAADAVLIAHLLFLLFVTVGVVLVFRWRRLAWLHVPAVLWGIGIELLGGTCPLTPLENRLRRVAGAAGSEGGFIEHNLLPVIYPGELTREIQIGLAVAVAVINLVGYAVVIRAGRRNDG